MHANAQWKGTYYTNMGAFRRAVEGSGANRVQRQVEAYDRRTTKQWDQCLMVALILFGTEVLSPLQCTQKTAGTGKAARLGVCSYASPSQKAAHSKEAIVSSLRERHLQSQSMRSN